MRRGGVLAQEPIDPGQRAEKGEAELTVAPALLARVACTGRVLLAQQDGTSATSPCPRIPT